MSTVHTALDALLHTPPADAARLAERRGAVSSAALQAALADRILAGDITAEQSDCVPLLARVLGAGVGRERLLILLFDAQAPPQRRALALAALFHEPDGHTLFDRLGPATRVRLADPWIRPMVALAPVDPDAQAALADLIASTPAAWRGAMVARIETCRRRLGTPAHEAYAAALVTPELADEWPVLFGHVLAEGPAA
ncbi:MAG: hypothetical protein KC613_22880 [Myxococcales bacterium]|nr:hypothetical protein [Myxococcales bacterium]MCB9524785.1 hypothetical protein [Myxococcales bacterium]